MHCTLFNTSVRSNATCCKECIGLGPQKYNLLYTTLSWTSAALSIPGGYVIDRIGNRVSVILIPLLCAIGMTLFVLVDSSFVVHTSSMYPLMLIGRILLAFGTGPGRVLQNRVVSFWFRENSVLPISVIILAFRSGNVLNFFLTANLAEWYGVIWALLTGMLLCYLGLLAGICLAILDWIGTRQLDADEKKHIESKKVRLTDLKTLPSAYWILVIMMSTMFSSVIPFDWNATKFFQDKYGYSKTESAYIDGLVYDISLLAPAVGKIFEMIDCHGLVGMFVSLVTLPIYLILGYTQNVSPLVMSICLGLTFTCYEALMVTVPQSSYGTAAGIVTTCMSICIGLTSLAAGAILGQEEEVDISRRLRKYQYMLLMFTCLTAVSFISALFMNILDIKTGCRLNRRLKKNNTYSDNEQSSETDPLLIN